MITGELKSQVDKIWEAFWTGGISNPLSVIEQFTYLLFVRRLDERQLLEENKAKTTGKLKTHPQLLVIRDLFSFNCNLKPFIFRVSHF